MVIKFLAFLLNYMQFSILNSTIDIAIALSASHIIASCISKSVIFKYDIPLPGLNSDFCGLCQVFFEQCNIISRHSLSSSDFVSSFLLVT